MRCWMLGMCLLVVLESGDAASGRDHIRTVALIGQTAPGTDLEYNWFGDAILNNAGQVVFKANLVGGANFNDRIGVWLSNRNGTIWTVGEYGRQYSYLNFNDRAELVYGQDYALFTRTPFSEPRMIVSNGANPSISSSGSIVFKGTVGITPGVGTDDHGSLSLVEDFGPAVDDPQGREFRSFGDPQINEGGQVLFNARLASPPFDRATIATSVYMGDSAEAVRRIAGNGDTLLTDRGTLQVSDAWAGEINSRGTVSLLINGYTILRHTSDGNEVVADAGDSIGDEHVFYFGGYALAGTDQIVYQAAMIGGAAVPNQTFMIVKDTPDAPEQIIARTGTPAPGANPGEVFGRFGGY